MLAAVAALVLLAGCTTAPDAGIRLPPAGAGFDYQLGGGYAAPPGEGERWLAAHPDLVLRDADGEPFVDPGWPDEFLLDTSSAANREQIAAVLGTVVASCAASGFDAVEIDNLDTYARSGGALTIDDNIDLVDLAARYARVAHDLGLAIAQKNGAGNSLRLRGEVGFDFVVSEECARDDECADYVDAYGGLVFDIEYSASFLTDACDAVASAVLRDLDLTTPASTEYVFETC